MRTHAVVMAEPGKLDLESVSLIDPGAADTVVAVTHSGISTGTEKLLWEGRMPSFPGMGYPLVPGYEAVGEVVEAGTDSGRRVGDKVFVPGAHSFGDVRALFGAAAATLVVPGTRTHTNVAGDARGILLALAATAHHAVVGGGLPDLIVGHGVVGRLTARIAVALGGAPIVWEAADCRRDGATGYRVTSADVDDRRDYATICDCSGDAAMIDTLVARLAKGGEIVLAGFYPGRIDFAFAPAFMREARLRIAAEWTPADMIAVGALIDSGALSLDELLTHRAPATRAATAYATAFTDPQCLKMVLDLEQRMTLGETRSTRDYIDLGDDGGSGGDATPAKKETQIIAIYGKGGIGKSFTLANLSYMMAQQGKRVLLIGCDPKSDTTSLLFGGKACPTIIETSSKKKLAGDEVKIEDVCFKRDGVFAMELGGPEVGRGCGGRGIIHGFETLEKLGFHDWGFDYVLLDFLGDVVCGGFGLPIARDLCQKVIVVASNDMQSLYVANNVCSAVDYFSKMGGNVGVAGMVINKDDGTGEAQAFASAVGIPILAAIPANEDIRKKSANYQIIGRPDTEWAPLFEELSKNVAEAPPIKPNPLDQDALLNLFSADETGRDYVLQPASLEDMHGRPVPTAKTLEVIYETV